VLTGFPVGHLQCLLSGALPTYWMIKISSPYFYSFNQTIFWVVTASFVWEQMGQSTGQPRWQGLFDVPSMSSWIRLEI